MLCLNWGCRYCATLTLAPVAVYRPCRCASCAHAGCVHPARRGCERCGCSAELDADGDRICFCDTCRVLGCSNQEDDDNRDDRDAADPPPRHAGDGGGAAAADDADAADDAALALANGAGAGPAAPAAAAAAPDPMAPCTHCGCMTSIDWKGGRRPALLWEEGGEEEPKVTLSAATIAAHGAAVTALTLSHCGSLHDSSMCDIFRVIGTMTSTSFSTVLTVLSWIFVGIHSRRALPCPVCA